MNPAGKIRCNMGDQIRLANHNCNFYRLIARILLPSTPLMTHSFASWQTRPAGKNKPSAGRGAYAIRAS
jgi:hypothetical protein